MNKNGTIFFLLTEQYKYISLTNELFSIFLNIIYFLIYRNIKFFISKIFSHYNNEIIIELNLRS